MMAMWPEAQQMRGEQDRGSGDDHCKQDLIVAAEVHAKPDTTQHTRSALTVRLACCVQVAVLLHLYRGRIHRALKMPVLGNRGREFGDGILLQAMLANQQPRIVLPGR